MPISQIFSFSSSSDGVKNKIITRVPCEDTLTHVLLDVVSAWLARRVGLWVAWVFLWALVGAVAAEEASPDDDQAGGSPPDIQSASKLIPVSDEEMV